MDKLFENENVRFWTAVLVGLFLKFTFSDSPPPDMPKSQVRKRAMAGITAGAAAAFYGTDRVMHVFSVDPENYLIVVIAMVLTGEHIVRLFIERAPLFASSIISAATQKAGVDLSKDDAK